MKRNERKERLKNLAVWSGGLLVVLLALYLIQLNFGPIVSGVLDAVKAIAIPAALSIFFTYLVYPMYQFFNRFIKSKNAAATVTIVVFFTVLIGFFALIVALLSDQISIILSRIDGNWGIVVDRLQDFVNILPADIKLELTDAQGVLDFNKTLAYLTSSLSLSDFFLSVFSGTANFISVLLYWIAIITLTPVFLFFFLKEGQKIFVFTTSYIPEKFFRQEFEDVARIANNSTGKYMRAKLISIFFLFLFFAVGFSTTFLFFGHLPIITLILYGVLFAMIIALLDLVPYIGPFLGIALPISFLLVLSESDSEFFIFSAILIAVDIVGQQLQKLIVEPVVMSKEVEVHPLAVLGGLLFFGSLFGFAGFILATPLIATINGVRNYFIQQDIEEDRVVLDKEIKEEDIVQNS